MLDRQPILEGELVRLRPLREADFDGLCEVALDPLLWEQHPAKERAELPGFRAYVDEGLASGGALTVIDRANGRIIGSSRYDRYDPERSEVEIGWTYLARSHWGGPYNAEMKRLMLAHAFESVDTVVFKAHSENRRSRRAIEKLGAVLVGTEPDARGRGENVVYRLERPTSPSG